MCIRALGQEQIGLNLVEELEDLLSLHRQGDAAAKGMEWDANPTPKFILCRMANLKSYV